MRPLLFLAVGTLLAVAGGTRTSNAEIGDSREADEDDGISRRCLNNSLSILDLIQLRWRLIPPGIFGSPDLTP